MLTSEITVTLTKDPTHNKFSMFLFTIKGSDNVLVNVDVGENQISIKTSSL